MVGYGLDLDQRYRNLPYVAALDDESSAAKAAPTPPDGSGPEVKDGRGCPIRDPMIRRLSAPRNRSYTAQVPC